MSFWQKCVLSPDAGVACSSCGTELTVPWLAVLSAVPVALGLIAAIRLPLGFGIPSALLGLLVYGALQRWVVPLITRKH